MTLMNIALSAKTSLSSLTFGSMSLHGPHHVVEYPTTRTFGVLLAVFAIASSRKASLLQACTAPIAVRRCLHALFPFQAPKKPKAWATSASR
eukprot:CAMPEP_0117557350 /NCGR_PEP_ID=MMETSP0784-20121206/52282_1 /TAXON_ID=39447 /ORGANISM="" /LENGTH=91 /DNA_ID=CAMNT_0005354659 /DNA_START=249 /DNA_END=524 /DNA_ORIENTATION=+